jgi:hypothetical protein
LRFGRRLCGAALPREPPNEQAQVRATPVRTNSAVRRRHHHQGVVLVQRLGWVLGA